MRLPLWPRTRDDDLEEVRSHLRMAARERIARGERVDEAEHSARREFGSVGLVKQVTREMWGWSSVERFAQDVRYGLRLMRRSPAFTAVAVLSLAFGIGANTAIFTLLNAILIRPLPYPKPDRLVILFERPLRHDGNAPVHPFNFLEWQRRARSFEAFALAQAIPANTTNQEGADLHMVVRSTADPAAMASAIRREVQRIDPAQTITAVKTMEQYVSESIARPRLYAVLVAAFAALALVLAAIGLYGLIAYGVSQRTHEIGIRIALGAQRASVLRMVLRQGARLAVAGLVTGVAAALALGRLVSNLLFGVTASDAVTYASVSSLLLLVALAAAYVPARRAALVDPTIALRDE